MKCFNQMIELFNIRSIAVVLPEVLLLFSCGLIDITDVVCQYFNRLSVTKDIDDIDVAPIVPMHTPMRKTIEQVAQKYNVLPKTCPRYVSIFRTALLLSMGPLKKNQ